MISIDIGLFVIFRKKVHIFFICSLPNSINKTIMKGISKQPVGSPAVIVVLKFCAHGLLLSEYTISAKTTLL